jgi:H+/Cl- antiporter ClcA
LKSIINSLPLILIAAIIGLIVSLVAQLFMFMAINVYSSIFNNKDLTLIIEVSEISLNLIPFLICVPSSILVGLLMYFLKLPRWHGPADTIYAAHQRAGVLDVKAGFGSTLASFISISGGASGQVDAYATAATSMHNRCQDQGEALLAGTICRLWIIKSNVSSDRQTCTEALQRTRSGARTFPSNACKRCLPNAP